MPGAGGPTGIPPVGILGPGARLGNLLASPGILLARAFNAGIASCGFLKTTAVATPAIAASAYDVRLLSESFFCLSAFLFFSASSMTSFGLY